MRWVYAILLAPALCAADAKWIQSHSGPVEIFSDAASRAAVETLATFEQFRFALGTLVGKPDLQMDPSIRILLLKNNSSPAAIVMGRDRMVVPLSADRGIPRSVFHDATRLFLQRNVARLPEQIERGLEDFFAGIDVKGAHVMWGAAPPAAERTKDWARIQLLATKPEYYGRLRPLLYNLQKGVADEPAYKNSIGKTKAEFEAEVDAYFQAGVFVETDGPSRALSAQRDLPVKPLDSEDAKLALADLLNAGSKSAYEAMLAAKTHVAEAHEGLALLALRDRDAAAAQTHLAQAAEAGSKNGAIWVAYAKVEQDSAKSAAAVDKALQLNPNLAEAHYLLGARKKDIAQLTEATKLDPQNAAYWDALAKAHLEVKHFGEAGKSWRAAEQAAATPAERDKMRQNWLSIEQQRLDYEDAERRRVLAEKERDTQRLKSAALAELRAAEARINGGAAGGEPVTTWWDDVHFEGTLKQVECLATQTRLVLEGADHKTLKLLLKERGHLTCGPQKARRVALDYSAKPDARLGTAGELTVFPQ